MYVYLAPLSDKTLFKIGKSDDPLRRITELAAFYDFDANKIVILKCRSVPDSFKIESSLHRLLEDYSSQIDGIGGTEFFDFAAYEEAVKMVCSIQKLRKYSFVKFTVDESVRPGFGEDIVRSRVSSVVRGRRIELGLTQTALAKKANVARRTVERLESTGQATLSNFYKVLAALGLGNSILAGTVVLSVGETARTRKIFVGDNDHDPDNSGEIHVPA